MAVLYKLGESAREIKPANGRNFQLKEMYQILGVDMIEILHLGEGKIMVCDEEGKLKESPQINIEATVHYEKAFGPLDVICGNALICNDSEVR